MLTNGLKIVSCPVSEHQGFCAWHEIYLLFIAVFMFRIIFLPFSVAASDCAKQAPMLKMQDAATLNGPRATKPSACPRRNDTILFYFPLFLLYLSDLYIGLFFL